MAEASELPRDLAAEKIKEAEGLRDVIKNLGILERGTEGLGLKSYESGSALQGVPPRNIRDREPMRALPPHASLPSQRGDSSMDDTIWRLINNNMGVA